MIHKWKEWLTSRIWIRLTIINIMLLAVFILFSGLTIYNAACMLADDIGNMEAANEFSFRSTLLDYFWVISVLTVLVGSLIYMQVIRRGLKPIRELVHSMERLKSGEYPEILKNNSKDEVGQLVSHFNHLIIRLQENEETRNRLISDMSHELRTPLSNLQGYLEALNKGVIQGDPAIYQSLSEEVERVTGLVQQLDVIKQWDATTFESFTSMENADINELLHQAVQLFSLEFERKGITYDVDATHEQLCIHRQGMLQVLSNLLSNAIEYYGGEGPVRIKGESEQDRYVITISGTGKYIPPEDKKRIFDRLYRVDPSRARTTGGSGLGLAISKEIVERHDGTISLITDGRYHRFVIRLPFGEDT
ncbi:sensor histidine kinase [Thalassobacillus hwangdonensis]|uniref:histidine kinase n=1 Tax=Thalassobacillus hwangdonensis TaxID=546108 RepID=A0ABW3KZC5_9BACI